MSELRGDKKQQKCLKFKLRLLKSHGGSQFPNSNCIRKIDCSTFNRCSFVNIYLRFSGVLKMFIQNGQNIITTWYVMGYNPSFLHNLFLKT